MPTVFKLAGSILLLGCSAWAQSSAPKRATTVWVRPGYYKQLKPDRLKSVVGQMLKQDVDENPPSTEGVMFVGSSTIADWDLRHYFPQYRTINRGINDLLIAEATLYADQLIIPFKPSTLVFYAGDNDTAYGMPPERVAADFEAFIKKIRTALPKTEIVVLSIRPTIARIAVLDAVQSANEKIKAIAAQDKQLHFVDIADLLTTPDGKPVRDMLAPDLQHLNMDGFDLISSALRAPIKQAESQYWRGFAPPRGQ